MSLRGTGGHLQIRREISAVSNVCQHQNGPLGEGKILDGCITCPWHGLSVPFPNRRFAAPFRGKGATFNVRVQNGRVFVHPKPNRPGVRAEPAQIGPDPGKLRRGDRQSATLAAG